MREDLATQIEMLNILIHRTAVSKSNLDPSVPPEGVDLPLHTFVAVEELENKLENEIVHKHLVGRHNTVLWLNSICYYQCT